MLPRVVGVADCGKPKGTSRKADGHCGPTREDESFFPESGRPDLRWHRPIVPVVIRNAGEIMWRASLVARPGTVDVVVLPPVPTEGLGAEDVEDLADRVRQQFVDTLDNWPAGPA